jgi:hypothetical protein
MNRDHNLYFHRCETSDLTCVNHIFSDLLQIFRNLNSAKFCITSTGNIQDFIFGNTCNVLSFLFL